MNPERPTAPAIPGRPACQFCGTPLDPHRAAAGAVCGSKSCQARQVQEASRAVFRRDWSGYVASLREALEDTGPRIARAARLLGTPPEELAIGVVPRQNRPLVVADGETRARFTAHLDRIVDKAFSEPVPKPLPEEEVPTPEEDGRATEPGLVQACCATCQGRCCILGNQQNAFLTANDIRRYRREHPEVTAGEVRAMYLDLIPDQSVEFSCVYHGATGCVVPRELRSETCNRYHCNQQTQLLQRLRDRGARQAVIVAHSPEEGAALAVFDSASGWQAVPPDPDATAEPDAAEALAAFDAALDQLPLPLTGVDSTSVQPSCRFCATPLTPHQAATTRCCGAPPCEQRRLDEMAARLAPPAAPESAASRRGQRPKKRG